MYWYNWNVDTVCLFFCLFPALVGRVGLAIMKPIQQEGREIIFYILWEVYIILYTFNNYYMLIAISEQYQYPDNQVVLFSCWEQWRSCWACVRTSPSTCRTCATTLLTTSVRTSQGQNSQKQNIEAWWGCALCALPILAIQGDPEFVWVRINLLDPGPN